MADTRPEYGTPSDALRNQMEGHGLTGSVLNAIDPYILDWKNSPEHRFASGESKFTPELADRMGAGFTGMIGTPTAEEAYGVLKRLQSGEPMSQIKKDTGIFLATGNAESPVWKKFYTSDVPLKDRWDLSSVLGKDEVQTTMGKVYNNEPLYKAYPELRDSILNISKYGEDRAGNKVLFPGDMGGEYNQVTKEIYVRPTTYPTQLQDFVAHEFSHKLRDSEIYTGKNLNSLGIQGSALGKYSGADWDAMGTVNKLDNAADRLLDKMHTHALNIKWGDGSGQAAYDEAFKRFQNFETGRKGLYGDKLDDIAFKSYRNNLGESEANIAGFINSNPYFDSRLRMDNMTPKDVVVPNFQLTDKDVQRILTQKRRYFGQTDRNRPAWGEEHMDALEKALARNNK